MKTNPVAKLYGLLTPEERFRLILAAGARGDQAEQKRLANAASEIALRTADYMPWAKAFNELASLTQ
jgi:hypothetical protein